MITCPKGHPIERFDPRVHNGWLRPDGHPERHDRKRTRRGTPSGKTDLYGEPIMKYDPAIHLDSPEARNDDMIRMDQYRSRRI